MNKSSISKRARQTLNTPHGKMLYYNIRTIEEAGMMNIERVPYSIRVLVENVIRQADGGVADENDISTLASWRPDTDIPNTKRSEFPYMPARVVLQDFTGVPVITDLAAMRDAVVVSGGNPDIINPIVRTDLIIDHSVQVDYFGTAEAITKNIAREFERNIERYKLLKWAQSAFRNLRIMPPGIGIVHQVNLEYLADVVGQAKTDPPLLFPDTCVGTDSHTTMINGLGVLGWGVGGIEAEAVMLGQPYYMVMPDVVGVRLTGEIPEGTTATDLVLMLTSILRRAGVVEKFVEFYGPGLATLPVADRATIANMAPEYGATCGFFPIDEQTIRYMQATGRDPSAVDLVERYAKENLMWHDPSVEPQYSTYLEFDLSTVETSLAGPKRPQDRIPMSDVPVNFRENFQNDISAEIKIDGEKAKLDSGAVVIAAITSCTNTSNPSVMVGAGLVARNALAHGLRPKPWVKTSMAPGSRVVTEYLHNAGLDNDLNAQGFNTVGYGCTTCIGNSGPLIPEVASAIDDTGLTAAAVLSGNRNFEGRIHPQVRANYLASPMLVVAYSLVGQMGVSLTSEPIGISSDGSEVYLRDLWPTQREIFDVIEASIKPEMFRKQYALDPESSPEWRELATPKGNKFAWDSGSTYIRRPPYFDDFEASPKPLKEINGARVLAYLGDSVTTDHISPAGSIPLSAPSGQHLIAEDVPRSEFNSYGARRGNHDVMVRGTFGNVRLRNRLSPEREGDWTVHMPDMEEMRVYDAAMKYCEEEVPLIVLAGKEYGTGSSRDWAAKGPMLLGVRAVIAQSYERIHRANLVGMGVLPLQFKEGDGADILGLTGYESFNVQGITHGLQPGATIEVTATTDDGRKKTFETLARIDTAIELEYYRHGGLLPFVLRKMLAWA